MAIDNNIKTFTAADIEKYHQGLLSNKERHNLEKAAMDDPFLADALEGYAVTGVNVAADIADLKKRLAQRTEEAKVIPLDAGRNNNFKLLRAAVVIAFVAGAAFLMYQFNGNKKESEIAQTNPGKNETVRAADSVSPSINSPVAADGEKPATISTPGYKKDDGSLSTVTVNKNAPVSGMQEISGGNGATKEKVVDAVVGNTTPVVNNEPKRDEDLKIIPVEKNKVEADVLARQKAKDKPVNALKKETEFYKIGADQTTKQEEAKGYNDIVASKRADEQQLRNQQSNIFRGRITDVNNVGVPFANVTNTQDNVGTYSDAKGFFNLTYPDSVLNVQVRSIGFENNAAQLRNNVASTQIVLQDDRKSLSEVVVSNQKPNAAARSRESNVKIEESEPTDGWDNYDTYLSNNLNVPDDFKTKQAASTGSVQVSFEVDKNGEPTNIRVEKSLCNTCDKEAIRLVKQGPKWKRAASKKGRTTVTINF